MASQSSARRESLSLTIVLHDKASFASLSYWFLALFMPLAGLLIWEHWRRWHRWRRQGCKQVWRWWSTGQQATALHGLPAAAHCPLLHRPAPSPSEGCFRATSSLVTPWSPRSCQKSAAPGPLASVWAWPLHLSGARWGAELRKNSLTASWP